MTGAAGSGLRWAAVAACLFVAAATILPDAASAKYLTLKRVDAAVVSSPVVEFRARTGVPGHAFIALGRKLPDGSVVFYAAGGFYPKHGDSDTPYLSTVTNPLVTFKNTVYGPGEVTFKEVDTVSDEAFRVNVTPAQEAKVKAIFDTWDSKSYALAYQNCVSLSRDVARSLGLAVPEFNPADADKELPYRFVRTLGAVNGENDPIRFARKNGDLTANDLGGISLDVKPVGKSGDLGSTRKKVLELLGQ